MGGNGQDVRRITTEVLQKLEAAARDFVPWFCEQMPAEYFHEVDAESRLKHIGAILAVLAAGDEPHLRLRSADGRHITLVTPEDRPGTLGRLMRSFGAETIRGARLYSSRDERLIIDVFDVGASTPCDLAAAPPRLRAHADAIRRVHASGGVEVALENERTPRHSTIRVAVAGTPARVILRRIANRLGSLGINITGADVDVIRMDDGESVALVTALVQPPGAERLEEGSSLWRGLACDLLRLKWLAAGTIALGERQPALGLGGAEVLHAYCHLAHQLLVRENRWVFSRARIREIAAARIDLSIALVDLFRRRFDPDDPLADDAFAAARVALEGRIAQEVDDEIESAVLGTIARAIGATRKTNYYCASRYALALRLDPAILAVAGGPQRTARPYGVFFLHGRGFDAFHVRFRDIARGGLRVVRPSSREQWARESERLYDEAYDLAWAQQQKNKDIPEGGAKGVMLVAPGHDVTRCIRAFTDGLLDLITPEPATCARVVDHLGVTEWLYLGPDENVTDDHIRWMARRAAQRGYPSPDSLVSSKPDAGINHREYGVTSEGVCVYLDVALRAVGIDPSRQPFTVKLTGGPDGDVAGNSVRILIRDHGERVAFVGIADGSGVATDPRGLPHAALLDLVRRGRPIAELDPAGLSPAGVVLRADTPEGVRARNEMHNAVVADAFIPAGGRPQTLNAQNWHRHLDGDGRPRSRVIVEGANLFLTPEARCGLGDAGVAVVKDSSANKCGVVCSSYEILSLLLLGRDEFLRVKPTLVAEVVALLRRIARREAELLFEEHARRRSMSLVDLSILLSEEINRLTDAVGAAFPGIEAEHPGLVDDLLRSHLPPILVARAGDRLRALLPPAYRAQLACAVIASRIVYREGLGYLRDTPTECLPALAVTYLLAEQGTRALVAEVETSGLAHAREIAKLVAIGGTRATLKTRWRP